MSVILQVALLKTNFESDDWRFQDLMDVFIDKGYTCNLKASSISHKQCLSDELEAVDRETGVEFSASFAYGKEWFGRDDFAMISALSSNSPEFKPIGKDCESSSTKIIEVLLDLCHRFQPDFAWIDWDIVTHTTHNDVLSDKLETAYWATVWGPKFTDRFRVFRPELFWRLERLQNGSVLSILSPCPGSYELQASSSDLKRYLNVKFVR
jgi:hypothetical protein